MAGKVRERHRPEHCEIHAWVGASLSHTHTCLWHDYGVRAPISPSLHSYFSEVTAGLSSQDKPSAQGTGHSTIFCFLGLRCLCGHMYKPIHEIIMIK